MKADAVVLGAGIIGISVALHVQARGRFEQIDHHRRGKHVHEAAAHARGGVLLAYDEL